MPPKRVGVSTPISRVLSHPHLRACTTLKYIISQQTLFVGLCLVSMSRGYKRMYEETGYK